jgi:hypothetical protein
MSEFKEGLSMLDIRKWFQKNQPIDLNALHSLEKDELQKIAKENKITVDEKADKNEIITAIEKFVETKKQEDAPPEAKAYRYVCEEDCVYLGKFRRVGDVVTLPEKKEVPHFRRADEKKD